MATRKASKASKAAPSSAEHAAAVADMLADVDVDQLDDATLDLLRRAAAEGEQVEAGGWLKFPVLGTWHVGIVHSKHEGGRGKVQDPYFKLRTPDGALRPMGLGGNLSTLLTGDMVGHVVTVVWAGEQDVAQKSLMKVYKVFDHGEFNGHNWPSYTSAWLDREQNVNGNGAS